MNTVVIISQDVALVEMVRSAGLSGNAVAAFGTMESAIDYIYNSIPHLVVIEMLPARPAGIRLLNALKSDPIFTELPVLAVIEDDTDIGDWDRILVDDFIRRGDLLKDLTMRITLCLARSQRIVEINPLTRLPGNISINKHIQDRMDKGIDFALAYADLDNFKPFNDKYGFSRGDEVIKVTARIVLNTVKNRQGTGSFVGHIGGDDFVYITDRANIEIVSQEIIDSFDRIIATFYDGKDRSRGFIDSVDRRGNRQKFPVMTISIGVAFGRPGQFTHYGQITQVAADMKKQAKISQASCYRLDRRRWPKDAPDSSTL